jgi:hypothetical protein
MPPPYARAATARTAPRQTSTPVAPGAATAPDSPANTRGAHRPTAGRRIYNRGMQGEITGVILVVAFAAAALCCAVLAAKLWRSAAASGRRPPD